jgi:hypothetical protein
MVKLADRFEIKEYISSQILTYARNEPISLKELCIRVHKRFGKDPEKYERNVRATVELLEYEQLKDALFRIYHCGEKINLETMNLIGSSDKGYFIITDILRAKESMLSVIEAAKSRFLRYGFRKHVVEMLIPDTELEPTLFDELEGDFND